ncbi:Rieske (2Fe-2S) protein [Dactylosporangium sp. NPDC049140]|uniref:Rieske (2Fe-2S) protein n=1 Tax=Dactylosporangium sp. NPDC049140 TaxID=3155647 RepID=UPI0033D54271
MTEDRVQPCAHRRALLAGLGGLSAATLLAACGGKGATAQAPAPEPAQSSGPAAGPSAGPSAAAGGSVADTGQVPVGGGIVQNGLLIVQPVSGTFKLFDAACPHKGVLVTAPQNGVAVCPAHASKFNIADGSKIDGPTPSGLKEIKSKVDGTKIMRLE